MKREEFQIVFSETFKELEELFSSYKNFHDMEDDVLHNLRVTARRVIKAQYDDEHEDMFRVLACFVEKHWVALCETGLQETEFKERCKKIIVYMLLAIALYEDWLRLTLKELSQEVRRHFESGGGNVRTPFKGWLGEMH